MKKLLALALCLLLCLPLGVSAQDGEVEIYTAQDLLAIGDDPSASYILMNDIDMAGISWPCPAFSGKLNGNGHAILNLTITAPGEAVEKVYDGNRKGYDAQFAGLFSTMKNARVENLSLVNLRAAITADTPFFLGSVAGAAWESEIENCTVSATLELRAHDKIFGVGGVAGYGSGLVKGCDIDVTLICTDTGKDTMDEQFLGGVLANGFMDVRSCDVRLDAYASEYGYAHTGGIVGMYFQWPFDHEHYGRILYNTVEGKITFFECNTDRRAYCKAIVGEPVADLWGEDHNKTENFRRDERKEYDTELRPHSCASPAYTQQEIGATCESFGYTQYTCACGYSYREGYTLKAHSFGPWQVMEEPSAQAPGKSQAVCALCGAVTARQDPYIPPETTPEATTPEATTPETTPEATQPAAPQPGKESSGGIDWVLIVLIALVVIAALAVIYFVRENQRRKRRRRRRRNVRR